MRKVCLILSCILLAVFTFIACNKKDVTEYHYIYQGENDLWNAEYRIDCIVTLTEENGKKSSDTVTDCELVVTYKGELTDLSSVRHVEISYKSSTRGGNLIEDYEPGGSISSKIFTLKSGGRNDAIPVEDDVINVTIITDDQTQTLELYHNK